MIAQNEKFILKNQLNSNICFKIQVRKMFSKCVENLRTNYLDALIHWYPMHEHEQHNMEVWNTYEELHREGGVRLLGLSNVYNLTKLQRIYENANIKPAIVQNRFYPRNGYDTEIREFCTRNGICYQSTSTVVSSNIS